MANHQHIALTKEAHAERRKQEQQLTEQAVAQLRSSAGWQRWLTVRARVGLRRFSVRNQLLVALQRAASHCLLGVDDVTVQSSAPTDRPVSAGSPIRAGYRQVLASAVGPFVRRASIGPRATLPLIVAVCGLRHATVVSLRRVGVARW